MKNNPKFIELLKSNEILNENILKSLLKLYKQDAYKLLLHLVKLKPHDRDLLGNLWGDSIDTAYVNLSKINLYKDLILKIRKDFAQQYNVLALYQFGNVITVATSNTEKAIAIDKLEKELGGKISVVFAFEDEINQNIAKYYYDNSPNIAVVSEVSEEEEEELEYKPESLIFEETKKELVYNVKKIIDDSDPNAIPDKETCNVVGEKISKEVEQKIDIMQCINQFRISDEYAYAHLINVATLSTALGKTLGLSKLLLKELTLAGLLHDIGKIRLPRNLRFKTEDLTRDERIFLQKHPEFGYQIIQKMNLPDRICEVARDHHERKNGAGYPQGKIKGELGLYTKIISIVDTYENMIFKPPYGKGMSKEKAVNIILLEGMRAFDSEISYKFASMVYKNELK